MKRGELTSGVAFLIVAGIFLLGASLMPGGRVYGYYAFPGMFPILLSLVLVVMSVVMVRRALKPTEEEEEEESEQWAIHWVEVKRLLAAAIFCMVFVLSLRRLHFVVLTSIFLALFSFTFYRKNIPLLIGTAVGISLGIFYVFNRLFLLPLP